MNCCLSDLHSMTEAIKEVATAGDGVSYSKELQCRVASLVNAVDKSSNHFVDAEIVAAREWLPISKRKQELLRVLEENQIVIIIGETGCGKTTQIPQYLKEIGLGIKGRIGCTQLRRVAAKAIAKRVAREQGCEVGEEVGFTIRFEDCTGPRTQIQFMTDGILLRECDNDRMLSSYSAIILDESHERTIDTDLLLGVLRWVCQQRKDLKLIISSATLDAQKFSSFFFDAKVFSIDGRMFSVEEIYCPQYSLSNPDHVDRAARQIIQINTREADGDIMVFMTGEYDIAELCEKVARLSSQSGSLYNTLIVLPCHSTLPWEEQEKIFKPAETGTRKVVIATNIAETSLTVDGIRYVIDSGYVKQKVYDHRKEIETLKMVRISKAQAIQRAGRAGRVAPGKCYRLYSKLEFENFSPGPDPQIKRSNLTNAILLLKKIGFNDVNVLRFIDQPPAELVREAEAELKLFGAADANGQITDLGRKMASFPLEPNLAKMLVISEQLGCSEEILTIVALLSVADIFIRPRNAKTQADQAKAKFSTSHGDLVRMLNVYNAWLTNDKDQNWCRENFIHGRFLHEASKIREQLCELMKMRNMSIRSAGSNMQAVLKSISAGFIQNVAQKRAGLPRNNYQYATLPKREPGFIFPGSSLFRITPNWVVYQKVVETKKAYMRGITPVKAEWIREFAPSTYNHRYPDTDCFSFEDILELNGNLDPYHLHPVDSISLDELLGNPDPYLPDPVDSISLDELLGNPDPYLPDPADSFSLDELLGNPDPYLPDPVDCISLYDILESAGYDNDYF